MNGQLGKEIGQPSVIELVADLERIVDTVPTDLGSGGGHLAKTLLMAYLAIEHDLRTYVEIGVYRGGSFLPMARAMQLLGGMAYGIDPYDKEMAREYDLDEAAREQVNSFIDGLDFSQMYQDVSATRQELGLTENCELIRQPSAKAINYLRDKAIAIDMIHIDGNHDTKHVLEDVELYLPLVSDGGFIVMDDIDWPSVKPALDKLKRICEVVFSAEHFAILAKGTPRKSISPVDKSRLEILHSMVENFEENGDLQEPLTPETSGGLPKISVVVISYNQEKYIADCLEGILAQRGDFRLELVVGDDSSTDGTNEIILNYAKRISANRRFEVKILPTDHHYGMIPNFKRCLDACTGAYFAVCEGDDYWIDKLKLQKQMDFLRTHPECSLCFNDVLIHWQETGMIEVLSMQQEMEAEITTTRHIILEYAVGNISSCMFDAQYLRKIPESLFDLGIGDWMFNIYYSQFGKIGHIRELMSVYRKHKEGAWSGLAPSVWVNELHSSIEKYNKYMHYEYDAEFSVCQMRLEASDFYTHSVDLVIYDDLFPDPLSAFRMQEFVSYLKAFPSMRICSTGGPIELAEKKPADDILSDFKRRHPEYAHQVKRYYPHSIRHAKVMYSIFLNNAYQSIDIAEELNAPFVFTLYPGGGFGINNPDSDMKLGRVTASPCFRKVIVTQRATYDYLIRKQFCSHEQIAFIYGGTLPHAQPNHDLGGRSRFGIDKTVMDICFVAHEYTEKAVHKDYEVFIEVARRLCPKCRNIHFHVVGGFDQTDIDVSSISERITFYGVRDMDWLDSFYRGMDIILSPNIPALDVDGSSDDFPTSSCVDAAMREAAVFCTDELHLNRGYFSEGQEIVIVPRDSAKIAKAIEHYYRRPDKLASIAEQGSRRIKQLFSYESQILPRIATLKEELAQYESSSVAIRKKMSVPALARDLITANGGLTNKQRLKLLGVALLRSLKRPLPPWFKAIIKAANRRIRGNKPLFDFLKRITPASVKRLYHATGLHSSEQTESDDSPYRCPVCNGKVNAFVPLIPYYEENWKKYGFSYSPEDFETLNSTQYYCPRCGASDRDRLYALYLARVLNLGLCTSPTKILDIAPAYPLKIFLLKHPNVRYVTADKDMKDVDLVVDITNMSTVDEDSYDFFICSHVLEHVIDDRKALSELFRILKPGGSGILMVPINLRIDSIEEDPNIDDIGERWRRFGQDDHVRMYSKKGFIERVEEAGFAVGQYGVDVLGQDVLLQHGIASTSILYIVKKN